MKKIFNIKTLPFWMLLLMVIVLATATFIEKSQGTNYVYQYVYGAWWFTGLWGILVLLTLVGLYKSKAWKNASLFLFHISFVVILLGALLTKTTSQQGYVVLKQGENCYSMQADEGVVALPFHIQLDTFLIQYYPGTDAPADYVSHITIIDSKQGVFPAEISMNKILSYDGFRFYQSSFEPGGISILSVNRDVWGIPVTYAGYALFALSMLWLILSPKNQFRKSLANPLLKKTLMVVLCLLPFTVSADVLTNDKLTVNKAQAEEFGNLWMLYEGRITPIATFARDFTIKITGKPKFSYLNSEQFLMGFLFFPEKWQQAAVFDIKDKNLQKELNATTERACFNDFFDDNGTYKLRKYWNELSRSAKSPKLKEVEKLNEKIQLINMLHNGSMLKLFPLIVDEKLQWYSPVQDFSAINDTVVTNFIHTSLTQYYQALHAENEPGSAIVLRQLVDFQQHNASVFLPNEKTKKVEIFYLKHNFTSILFMANLTLGILLLFAFFALPGKWQKRVNNVFFVLLIISFLVHCASIGLRTYVAGRLPFSNGFETMLLIAWCAMLIAIVFYRKIPIMLVFGFLISGCALLVAHLGMMNPKITPLVPVLSSPLLSIHVSTIMISYTLFAFVALNGLISLLLIIFSRKHDVTLRLQQNKLYSLICLYPALFFLGVGIFIGAVWANVSWGRYWGWDPKEVWALITFLVYSFIFHERNIKFLSSPFAFHVFGLLAFSTVLMTYFGVNYFLGGMHSYAGGEMTTGIGVAVVSLVVVLLLTLTAFLRYRKQLSSIE